jgi:NADPH:quinone reductase-like Zn-dependent oxidoreductase
MPRVIKFSKAGAPEVLEFIDVPSREPLANEVRIKVKAIGINRAESMWRRDDYIEPVTFPAWLGYEAAGIVDAVGPGVEGIAVGDEVNVIPSFSQNQYGTYGEVINVPEHAVVAHPKALSYAEAASIWMMFITAYSALIEDARITSSDFVVIPAASSSVGLAAIQIANYAGATTIAMTRTADKRQALLDSGAAHVIVTDEADFVAEILRITEGNGARVIFDPVGGPNFPKLISVLGFQGIAFIYGALAQGATEIPVLPMIAKLQTVRAHNLWVTTGDPVRRKAAVEFVLKGIEQGKLKPVIDRKFDFDEMVDAHRYLEQNGQFGKIVVNV